MSAANRVLGIFLLLAELAWKFIGDAFPRMNIEVLIENCIRAERKSLISAFAFTFRNLESSSITELDFAGIAVRDISCRHLPLHCSRDRKWLNDKVLQMKYLNLNRRRYLYPFLYTIKQQVNFS